ncbi:MAG: HEAT repeat domain-containing protein [Archangiaceae bacterium]|nr:HEAT repeat domain-containing protein [Archangiaceae bacterium]
MGWNAGAFGSMRFPDGAAREAWLETTVSHTAWSDWFNELEGAWAADERVEERLARIAKGHDPASYCLQQVTVDGLEVSLRWDVGEDGFRDSAGDFAALFRCAESVGATGRFWFLGTAGAEGDFTYELALNGTKPSTVKELDRKARAAVYAGDGYRSFMERNFAEIEEANPVLKRQMTRIREGAPTNEAGASVHDEVMLQLKRFDDAQLLKAATSFPSYLPDGKGQVPASKLFTKAKVRAQLGQASNEELRGVALWVLGKLDLTAARPLVSRVMSDPKSADQLRAGAVRVLGLMNDADAVLQVLIGWTEDAEPALLFAAVDALRSLKLPGLESKVEQALQALSKKTRPGMLDPGFSVVTFAAQKHLAIGALARFAVSKAPAQARIAAAEAVVAHGDEEQRRLLLTKLKEEYGIGVPAAKAWLLIDPEAALKFVKTVGTRKKRSSVDDRIVGDVMEALEQQLRSKNRQALMLIDSRWVDACLAFIELKDFFLAHRALGLLGKTKRSPALQKRLVALLASGKQSPLAVVEALKGQGVKNVRALVKQRHAASKDKREKELLALFL